MRLSQILALVLATSVALACGGGDDTGSIDASAIQADADPSAPDATPTEPDAGATVGIVCGDSVCNEDTQDCCMTGTQTCVDKGTCEGTVFGCDGPEDCTDENEACCGGGQGSQCAADSCPVHVCHIAEDCPDTNHECCAIGMNVSICQPTCPGN